MVITNLFRFFRKYSSYGILFLRFAIGVFLIYGVQDNIIHWDRMLEFRDFLQAHGMLVPLFAAHLSVYVQFLCGLMLLAGAKVRLAGLLMILNFTVAILLVHLGQTFPEYYPAAQLIAVGFFFLFNGAGPVTLDAWIARKRRDDKRSGSANSLDAGNL